MPHEQGPDQSVREEYIPVVRGGHVVAVMTRHTNLWTTRTPSRLELTYLATADALCRMVTGGEYPHGGAPTGLRRGAPRVGDGVIRLDVDGIVTYASPNAVSALHRLGHLGEVVGASLAQIVTDNLRESFPVDEGLPLVVTGRQPWRTEVVAAGTTVSMRAIPLTEAGQRFGAIVLLRDVGELRRRERELLTKDATIREIHHRVKNNLQSVAALLRLQSRRLPDGEAKAALAEAERRVGTIAMVHDQLSQGFDETVDFDSIAQRGLNAVVEVSANGAPVHTVTQGSFGRLRAEDATSLAMIMSELVQNAIEHGLGDAGGEVRIGIERHGRRAGPADGRVAIEDDGKGIDPARRPGSGLGTQIVQSLVSDLQGRITWEAVVPARHAGPVHRAPPPDLLTLCLVAPSLEWPRRRHTRAPKSPATVTVTGLADGGRAWARRLERRLSQRDGPARCGASGLGARPRRGRPTRRHPGRSRGPT